jgi:hypothetical protein
MVLLVSVAGCGGDVRVDSSPTEDVETAAPPAERQPDPCRGHTDRSACCGAGCRIWGGSGEWRCISESHDCALHDDVCIEGERCDVHQTSGLGGCSYHNDLDTVGLCVPGP